MSRRTHRKLLRQYGGIRADGTEIKVGEVPVGEAKKIPMQYKGTTMVVSVVAGQAINPEKEYLRQLGTSKKRLKKLRAKAKKREVHLSEITN